MNDGTNGQSTTMNERKLTMKFAGRFIELLGQQMYGGPVPAVAELVANAWDADAPSVEISVPDDPKVSGATIVVKDTGVGMSFDQLNNFYLAIGYERRLRGQTTASGRPVMGRKGIGKLAGFGIAEDIVIRSVQNGQAVEIVLNYAEIRNRDALQGYELNPTFDGSTTDPNGVTVTFRRLKLSKKINLASFTQSMMRRFALRTEQMSISVNGEALKKTDLDFEFREPTADWKEENISGVGDVRYWLGFLKSPITDSELRGFSVYARGRMAQSTPFVFNLTGGISGQVGLEYLTGQVVADFLDEAEDCIATDRQSVNWQFERAKGLEIWGQELVKRACKEWKARREKRKKDAFRHDYSDLFSRIDKLPKQEREDVSEALDRIADLENVTPDDFKVIASSILSGVERESVKRVIRRINETSDDALDELVAAIKEWDVISAVATAEVVAGRIEILNKFKNHINERLPEKAGKGLPDMQSFIKDHPWLLGHEYERLSPADFHHEHGVDKWIADVLLNVDEETQNKKADEKDGRRFDLLCIKDDARIMILELIRPEVQADYDHVMRLNRYVTRVRAAINAKDTRNQFKNKSVRGFLIADDFAKDSSLSDTLNTLSGIMDAVTWRGLLENVSARYGEFLELLKLKAPEDPRLKGLIVPPIKVMPTILTPFATPPPQPGTVGSHGDKNQSE
jgi:hypothetical protein